METEKQKPERIRGLHLAWEAKRLKLEDIRVLHSALLAKHTVLNQLLWQAPVISLMAQAFLLNIAFDSLRSQFYRDLSGFLASFIGLLSWQLFLRHSAFEIEVSKDLEELERLCFEDVTIHDRKTLESYGCITRIRARKIWKFGLFIVSLAGLIPLLKHFAKASGFY